MVEKNVQWSDVKESYEANRISVAGGNNFIEVYDNALSRDVCDGLIRKFEQYDASGKCRQGSTTSHIDKTLKDSTDLIIDGAFMHDPANAEFRSLLGPVTNSLMQHAVKYLMKYHCLLPAVFESADGRIVLHQEMLDDPAAAMQAMLSRLTVLSLQIQRYNPPGQGYYAWHYESGSAKTSDRILFPIIYLNDVDSGGETEFYYWNTEVKPRAGRLVIAPGGFTHAHRMKLAPLSNAKYILTTWYTVRAKE
jgi:hypothetical protein